MKVDDNRINQLQFPIGESDSIVYCKGNNKDRSLFCVLNWPTDCDRNNGNS